MLLIVLLGTIIYSNTLHAAFQLDDDISIVGNFFIRHLSDFHLIWTFWPSRFLTYLSFAFNYHWHGLNVAGYHVFNLLVHLISALLVCWLVRLTLAAPAMRDDKIARHADLIALLAGLIFVAHPVQTEAVTYIVQRASSMAALFYLASLCFYVKFRSQCLRAGAKRSLYYIFSLLAAVAAMFTKEMAITLPFMVLLYEFSFFRTGKKVDWKVLTLFLLTLLIIPLTMLGTKSVDLHGMHRVGEGVAGISPAHYLFTQLRVMVTYIRLAFLPVHQNLDYDYPVSHSIFEAPTLLSLSLLGLVLYGAQCLFTKFRLLSFSIFWFFITLLPESSIVPIRDIIFEHRLYLAMAGYSIFLVSSAYYLLGHKNMKAMIGVLALVTVCYAAMTYQRNAVWKDNVTLWKDVLRQSPHKARPYNNLGNIYFKQGNTAGALADFNKAIELDPGYAEAYDSRSSAYAQEGQYAQALRDVQKSIELNPMNHKAYYNRAFINAVQNNLSGAIADFTKAIKLNPFYADAYISRGLVYLRQGNPSQAVLDLTWAIAIEPDNAQAYNNRGVAYGEGKDFDRAVRDFSQAIELNPRYAQAYYNRAGCYHALKQDDLARKDALTLSNLRRINNK